MEDNSLYSNVAVELLEIFNYLDRETLIKIPKKVIENLDKIKNEKHLFKINKTKSLEEQNLLKETKEVLSILFLKYCCTDKEVAIIIKENSENMIRINKEKQRQYNFDNIFKNNKNENLYNTTQLMVINKNTGFFHVLQRIKSFLKKSLKRGKK